MTRIRSPEVKARRVRKQMAMRRVLMARRCDAPDKTLQLMDVTTDPDLMRRAACSCMHRLGLALESENGVPRVTWNGGAAILYVARGSGEMQPPIVAASFCPLCGREYREAGS